MKREEGREEAKRDWVSRKTENRDRTEIKRIHTLIKDQNRGKRNQDTADTKPSSFSARDTFAKSSSNDGIGCIYQTEFYSQRKEKDNERGRKSR